MNCNIKISGEGTVNQLAIRLLEIGRKLQIADVYNHENELSNLLESNNDDIISLEYIIFTNKIITHNGLRLAEVGDYEAQNLN